MDMQTCNDKPVDFGRLTPYLWDGDEDPFTWAGIVGYEEGAGVSILCH